jgi:pimeloyl-ACP methyl ester carboxylesterase
MTVDGRDGWVDLGHPTDPCLLFVPGFMVPPAAYRTLLTPVADAGYHVVVPSLAGHGPRMLLGRTPPEHEAAAALDVIDTLVGAGWLALAGHSRGGLVAWLAAARRRPDRLVLVDPVAGGGPPWADVAPLAEAPVGLAPLVIGCGLGGACAPDERNHEVFAAAAPSCTHAVLEDAGHADMLDGRVGAVGRRVCRAGSDPAAVRDRIARLLVAHLAGGAATDVL